MLLQNILVLSLSAVALASPAKTKKPSCTTPGLLPTCVIAIPPHLPTLIPAVQDTCTVAKHTRTHTQLTDCAGCLISTAPHIPIGPGPIVRCSKTVTVAHTHVHRVTSCSASPTCKS